MELPNLSGIADPENIERKGSGRFTAEYINWSRTLQDIRQNAPGWTPESVENFEGNDIWMAPDGSGYLKLRWVHVDGTQTVAIPHAIMDNTMKSIPGKSITSRDVSDSFVRGACKSAAALFGYAWQLWSKDDPMTRDEPSEPCDSVTCDSPVVIPSVPGAEQFEGRNLDDLTMEELLILSAKAKSEKWKKLIAHAMNILNAPPEANTDGWA